MKIQNLIVLLISMKTFAIRNIFEFNEDIQIIASCKLNDKDSVFIIKAENCCKIAKLNCKIDDLEIQNITSDAIELCSTEFKNKEIKIKIPSTLKAEGLGGEQHL